MENIINIFLNNGVAIGVIIYFIWKDKELTNNNTTLLAQVKNLLTLLEVKFEIDLTGNGKIGEQDVQD